MVPASGSAWSERDADSASGPAWKAQDTDSASGPAWKAQDADSASGPAWKAQDADSASGPAWNERDADAASGPAWNAQDADFARGGQDVDRAGDSIWSAQDTDPEAIEQALRGLLAERHAESEGVAPGRALNMIAFVERAWAGEIANRMRGVGRYHASRLILLSFDPDRERLDGRASIAPVEPGSGEIAVLRETVVVEIGPRHLDDLLTIADPLLVSDMPTVLWSPHGHAEALSALLPLAQAVLLDSVDEPGCHDAIQRASQLAQQAYVVDLAWLRSTPWRERIATAFDPPHLRRELQTIAAVEIDHHPDSAVVALLLAGWLSARLGWRVGRFVAHAGSLAGKARARRADVTLALRAAPEQQERGLASVRLQTASGRSVSFERGPGGLRTRRQAPGQPQREWRILGASRGEGGILGEGIRQALLRDPTYEPALAAAAGMAP